MKKITLLFSLVFMASSGLFATANYVYHEATTNSIGCGGINFRSSAAVYPNQSMTIGFKVEFQFYTNRSFIYYTTNGSQPGGFHGAASGTSQVIECAYNCTFEFGGNQIDVCSGTIPAQPGMTNVRYIVSAWYDDGNNTGGPEVYANSGNCCGAITNWVNATQFSFTVLPIELTDFSIKKEEKSIVLNWKTATENQNDHFKIERSSDQIDWSEIGRVAGAGTSSEPHQYFFRDEKPFAGLQFYRLRQMDFDGSESLSKIVSLDFGRASGSGVHIFPNPTTDLLGLDFENSSGASEADFRVFDATGRLVFQKKIELENGRNQLKINALDFPRGLLFLEINDGQNLISTKTSFLVER